jgi:hypothetical protein
MEPCRIQAARHGILVQGMRYFTPLMWRALQQLGQQDDENHRKWEQAFHEYRQDLLPLRGRLDDKAFAFFDEADVHDGELLELHIMDGSRPAPLSSPARPWATPMNCPVKVELAVLDASDQFVWRLSYSVLRRVVVDFPGGEALFYQPGEGFGDWGYHELTDARDDFLRHEILFASGSSIAIEFKDLAVMRIPARNAFHKGPL